MDNFESLRNAIDTSENKTVTVRLKEVINENGYAENVEEEVKTKEERMRDFVKSLTAIEDAMQPYKEQRSDLKKNYVENGWLDKKDMKLLTKALRLVKDDTDIDELIEVYQNLKK
jgi:hypothetical protein